MEKRRKIRGDDPNLGKKKKPKGFRSLVIGDLEYFWMTDGYSVFIKTPKNKSIDLTSVELLGGTGPSFDGELVTPYDVKKYIEENQAKL